MSAHSRFGASSAHRWMRCPGSIKATQDLPNLSNPAADEGTMLHEVAACELEGLSHDYFLTDEQRECVDVYINLVRAESANGQLFVETKFKLPYHPEFWGTSDAIVVNGKRLKVLDFKAGRGVAVESDYNGRINPQLGFYALGACAHLGRQDWEHIELIICQPRFGGIKRRETSWPELMDLVAQMSNAAAAAESDAPPFEAGSHCKFCLANKTCPALREYVYELARMDFDVVT